MKYVYRVTICNVDFCDDRYTEQIFEEYTRTFERAINVCNALSGRKVNYKRICESMRGISHGANMQKWTYDLSESRDVTVCTRFRQAYIERKRVA